MIAAPFPTARMLAVLLLAALAWGTVGEIRVSRAEAATAKAVAQLNAERAQVAEAARAAEAKARAEEMRINHAHTEALNAAHTQSLAIARDRDRAASAVRSLREQLAAIRDGQPAQDPAAAPGCPAAGPTAAMLADLLGRCSERRDELARYADDARLAGQTCERAYSALIPTLSPTQHD